MIRASLPSPEFKNDSGVATHPFTKLQFPDTVHSPVTRTLSTLHPVPDMVRFPVILEVYPLPQIEMLFVDMEMFSVVS